MLDYRAGDRGPLSRIAPSANAPRPGLGILAALKPESMGSYFLSDSPSSAAILAALETRISAPARNRVMVGCGTPVRLAISFAESPDLEIARRSAVSSGGWTILNCRSQFSRNNPYT